MTKTIASIVSIHSEQKENLDHMKLCVKIITIDYCHVKIPDAHYKIIKFNQDNKSI